MDALLETIKTHRKVKESSLNTYKQVLNKMAKDMTGVAYENNNFLLDIDKVKEYFIGKSNSVRKKYISSINLGDVILIQQSFQNQDCHQEISNTMKSQTSDLKCNMTGIQF